MTSPPQPFSDPLGLVPALDVDSFDDLLRVVEKTCEVPGVAGYKLGLTGSLRVGLARAVKAIRRLTDLPILYDHQKAGPDMPDMASKFAAICREAGIEGLILFPVAGPQAVRAFVGETLKNGIIPAVGGHIPVSDYCISGGGFMADDVLHRIATVAAEVGARHFVLPANNIEGIRRHVAWSLKAVKAPTVFLTGIGPLGGTVEQAFAAAKGCPARFAIVGRGVCANASPGDAARRLIDAMKAAA
ncbi:MAG: orotidine 5-phosphate decarboxylase [Acidimicrobiia bacterium]|nr:orotidine 5-phosphate decarboxylase [Acidimicrobiia bacterium]